MFTGGKVKENFRFEFVFSWFEITLAISISVFLSCVKFEALLHGLLMKELLSMNIIEITSGNVKGPFTRTVSVSTSVAVTVKVYHCASG